MDQQWVFFLNYCVVLLPKSNKVVLMLKCNRRSLVTKATNAI